MSGGYFDRSTYAMHEIADTIERDIARALKPKPEKIQEDYWTIYEKDCFGSYHSYRTYMDFGCYDDAESFLLRDKTIVKVEQKYADRRFFDEWYLSNRAYKDVGQHSKIRCTWSENELHSCYKVQSCLLGDWQVLTSDLSLGVLSYPNSIRFV